MHCATMSSELHPDDNGTSGAQRVLIEQIQSAVAALTAKSLSDESVHRARKDLKRARATLRLLRPELGVATYRRDNAVLRNAARPLSAVRDTKVLLDTLDTLTNRKGVVDSAALQRFRKALRDEQTKLRARVLRKAALNRTSVAPLRALVTRMKRRSPALDARTVYGRGLKRTYKRGREASLLALSQRTDEHLHDWHKQVKYLWHQLEIVRPIVALVIGEFADQAHKLADQLGDDHDLAVLRERLTRLTSKSATGDELRALIDQRRAKLQKKAIALGSRLFAEKPRVVEHEFARCWDQWTRAKRCA